ncbi:succinate dehydrogenase assembly factor 2 [Yoonia sp. 208BN28-4]|uniref:succinate dehydrogenase assembly factor 2 n=1 Tax=Yoonia sp. 208BN28-4 TaxID=3126505 RepID=UPI0030A3CC49
MTNETHEARVKRLYMRSIRRGIKEMDLILSAYAAAHLNGLSDDDLALYDALLAENDHDILSWVTGHAQEPEQYRAIMDDIRGLAEGLTRPGAAL